MKLELAGVAQTVLCIVVHYLLKRGCDKYSREFNIFRIQATAVKRQHDLSRVNVVTDDNTCVRLARQRYPFNVDLIRILEEFLSSCNRKADEWGNQRLNTFSACSNRLANSHRRKRLRLCLITTRFLKSCETNCWRTLRIDEARKTRPLAQATGCQNFVRGIGRCKRALALAGPEIFTLWYKRARRVPGGLNLLLAFNGVCKLYSKKRARHGRLCARGKDCEEHERIEWSAEGDKGGNEKL
ncbi:hypothetical protein ALC57_04747 [Trachymyrmex cornetzi]|uniref:Uncharacterized protein n=1 Tax=Trachymyrmex cornetzi TaxID=471704 RepID=A0A195EDP3_9HYME|nr:hypothetical protein ALC57_04747 [Trachymyrmex cornetzi]